MTDFLTFVFFICAVLALKRMGKDRGYFVFFGTSLDESAALDRLTYLKDGLFLNSKVGY